MRTSRRPRVSSRADTKVSRWKPVPPTRSPWNRSSFGAAGIRRYVFTGMRSDRNLRRKVNQRIEDLIAPDRLDAAQQVDLLGMKFDALSSGDVVQRVMDGIRGGTGGWIMTPNLDHLRRFVREPQVRHYFSGPDLVVADGQPLVWASYLQGTPLPGRVAGSDLISSVSAAAADVDCRVFLLGGAGHSSSGAATTLTERYPGLQVVGTHCPPMGFESDTAVQHAINCVVAAAPDIVFVGLPFPKADALILRLKARLPRTWLFGLGVSFSFITGDVRRAPIWMQKSGCEWAWRLSQEPGRLSRRYIVDGIPFALRGAIRLCAA